MGTQAPFSPNEMPRILHTADVHLAADHPERREALEAVLQLAEAEDADLVTVGGDLFDSDVDAGSLRPQLRDLFADRPYQVLTIPGNHDEAAFQDDLFFGEDFQPAVADPFEHVFLGDDEVRVTCLPYTRRATEDLLVEFAEREPYEGTEILLLHCSLDAPFGDRVVGDEEERYFPISKETLAELDFDYYLAGHYHSAHRVELPNGGSFAYPGTPASVTRGETGPRNVALLDTEADRLELRTLETFHYDHLEVTVAPGEEDRALAEVESWVGAREDRNVEAELTVTGHVTTDESDFADDLEAASGAVPVTNDTAHVGRVVAHPLYQSFEDRLAERDLEDDLEDAVRSRTLRVFSDLVSGGRLS